eukprot:1133977-Pelagomonas_calceolata.AAC.3
MHTFNSCCKEAVYGWPGTMSPPCVRTGAWYELATSAIAKVEARLLVGLPEAAATTGVAAAAIVTVPFGRSTLS